MFSENPKTLFMVVCFLMEYNTQAIVEDGGKEEEDGNIYVVRPKNIYIHGKDHFPLFLKMSTLFAYFFYFSISTIKKV